MSSYVEIPTVNKRYACIVDREAKDLAAVISSCLAVPGSYVPFFLFPKVKVPRTEDPAFLTESYVAYLMADHADVLIGNALARMGKCEYLILAGLTGVQKSYLDLPKELKIIEIADLSEVPAKLADLASPTKGELRCRPCDLLNGLFIAQKRQKRLVIDENGPRLPEVVDLGRGLIVIENASDASPVIAVNYANSVGATVLIVDAAEKDEKLNVQQWIQDWKESDNRGQLRKLHTALQRRIGSTLFSSFEYVTFFTQGLPYSLLVENSIPSSYVHLSLRPDLFVFNSIMFSAGEGFNTAVVFSPVFFEDEETSWLSNHLADAKYFVRNLVGQNATLANFDFHTQSFPYDLLHICSHGGEVDGYEMLQEFVDSDGNRHVVEFDEVVGYTPVPDKPDMVALHRKVFPRTLDGFAWRSAELEEQKLPSHVYLDMWKAALECRGQRRTKDRIAMSCAIQCVDSIHQGEFNALASYSSPVIFNNTCWSWDEVAAFFLACGARGYIGTLWAIDNDAAVVAAKTFYEHLFSGPVLNAFHKALQAIAGTSSKNIYVYWGLHFTRLPAGKGIRQGHDGVRHELMYAVGLWVRKIESTKSVEVRSNSIRVLKSILRELRANFSSIAVEELETKVRQKIPDLFERDVDREQNHDAMQGKRSSADHPTDYEKLTNVARFRHEVSRSSELSDASDSLIEQAKNA